MLIDWINDISNRHVGGVFLEIGCGPRGLVKQISKYATFVVETDIRIHQRWVSIGYPDTSFLAADAMKLPFCNSGFDLVVMLNSLHHIPDPARAMDECVRVCKPGGGLFIIEPTVTGPLTEVIKPLDDETDVRGASIGLLQGYYSAFRPENRMRVTIESYSSFDAFDDFLFKITQAAEDRSKANSDVLDAVKHEFFKLSTRDSSGRYVLRQDLVAFYFLL
ncbi:class I SAM-dependent methyltransferase [Acetobacter sicerae]|uniref:Class I SAM-dependent methyltransferase n=1 Tax=Acetobacter sicerae TaxID=85325 RepID=A0ABS8VX38_9PROT|nr:MULTISPECIES: class I SAM-dependent methyltransferase [Acetobacter]MBC9008942.1 class I SAM-dependent methyltransferase [Acetobacter tropicalis]MCE0743893.1 class I SAM-dependent methyltransferase [Acetobacter sicerae]